MIERDKQFLRLIFQLSLHLVRCMEKKRFAGNDSNCFLIDHSLLYFQLFFHIQFTHVYSIQCIHLWGIQRLVNDQQTFQVFVDCVLRTHTDSIRGKCRVSYYIGGKLSFCCVVALRSSRFHHFIFSTISHQFSSKQSCWQLLWLNQQNQQQ